MLGELFHMDDSAWPVVILTIQGQPADRDYQLMYDGLERCMRRREPYLVISDVRRVTEVADARRRQEIAEWSKRMEARHGSFGLASIVVVKSALVKGSLTALQWLTAKKDRDIFTTSLTEAHQIAKQVLERANIPLPSIFEHTA